MKTLILRTASIVLALALASCYRVTVAHNYYGPPGKSPELTPEEIDRAEIRECEGEYAIWVEGREAEEAFLAEFGFSPAERDRYHFPKLAGQEIFPNELAPESPFIYGYTTHVGPRGDGHRIVTSWRWRDGPALRLANR